MTLTRSLDLWSLTAIVAAAVLLTLVDGPVAPRLPLGFLAVLFAPGYVMIAALFPHASSFDMPERIGVSIGVSLALISLLALILSFSPWRMTQDTVALSVAASSPARCGILKAEATCFCLQLRDGYTSVQKWVIFYASNTSNPRPH